MVARRGAPLEPPALAEQALDIADAMLAAAERRDSSGAQPEEGAG